MPKLNKKKDIAAAHIERLSRVDDDVEEDVQKWQFLAKKRKGQCTRNTKYKDQQK